MPPLTVTELPPLYFQEESLLPAVCPGSDCSTVI